MPSSGSSGSCAHDAGAAVSRSRSATTRSSTGLAPPADDRHLDRPASEADDRGMTTAAEKLRIACPRSKWTGASKRCQWCNLPLTGIDMKRRRTWCSERCFETFQRHHLWSHAKPAALVASGNRCAVEGCTARPGSLLVVHAVAGGPADYSMSCSHHAERLLVLCPAHKLAREQMPVQL